jgi:ATP-dependent helicase/nuclease subunit A
VRQGAALTLFDAPPGPAACTGDVVTLPGGREATAQQAAAITRRAGSLQLSATAGSGKTAVLVERFVRAVLEDAIAPARILAITFTDKAAGELRERIRARFVECGARDAARETESAFVSTIHGFCARILRGHALAAGLDPGFSVLDEAQAARLRDEAFEGALEDLLAGDASAVDLVAAYGADRLAGMVVDAHETLRSRGDREPRLPDAGPRDLEAARAALRAAHGAAARELQGSGEAAEALGACATLLGASAVPLPDDLRPAGLRGQQANAAFAAYAAALDDFAKACADHHAARAWRLLGALLRLYADRYRGVKRERSALDFDDLELEARALLESDDAIRREWSERFALVMVDEFQDTNPRQLGLLEALERDYLFCVGDELQSIYGFRDADVGLFRARRDRLAPQGGALALTTSFRARPEVVAAVNVAFTARLGEGFVALEAAREKAADREPRVELLLTDTNGWDEAGDVTALGPGASAARPWRRAEAKLLAQRVRELVDDGTCPGDVAVLLRAASDLPVYERAIEQQGLPTASASAGGFWSRLEVADLLAYVALIANPLDDRALYAVLASPLVGASSDALALLAAARQRLERNAWWTLEAAFAGDDADELGRRLDAADRTRLAAFVARFRAEREASPRLPIAVLLARAVRASAYEGHLSGVPGGARAVRNLRKLLHVARAFEEEHGRNLRAFLEFAATRARTPVAEVEAAPAEGDEAAVRLMTIHGAKGLEFEVVCVADLGRAPALRTPDVLVDGLRGGLRLLTLDGGPSIPALDYPRLREERLAADAEEEDRVFFVALTRARDRLILSGAVDVASWPNGKAAPPVSWLARALVPDLSDRLDPARPEQELQIERDGHRTRLRCLLSAPATVGRVLQVPAARPAAPRPSRPSSPWQLRPQRLFESSQAATAAISYSALAEYGRCAYRFYLQRELGLPERAPDGGRGPAGADARTRGVLAHRLLESLDLDRPAPPDATRVEEVARAMGASLPGGDAEELAVLIERFAASELRVRLGRAREVHREREFTFALAPETLVTGVMDVLALEDDGRALVVDYKSDRVGDAALRPLVEDLYGAQQRLYALAALRAGAAAAEVVYCFLERPAEPIAAHFAADDAAELERDLRTLATGLLAREFPVTREPHKDLCLTCPGRRALCSWPEEMTLRPGAAARPAPRASSGGAV